MHKVFISILRWFMGKRQCRHILQIFTKCYTVSINIWLWLQIRFKIQDISRFGTLPWQWSLITISQENHWFHHTFPTDHCRLVSISSRKVRWRSSTYKGHLSLDVTHLHYSDVCVWSVWRLKCFSSNLVHLHKRYRVKWVTCIRAFDVGNDFPAYQISC